MTYNIGDEIPLSRLDRGDSVGYEVAIIARGEVTTSGLIGVGCHQHPLRDVLLNGGKVEPDPDFTNPMRPMIVTAYGTIREIERGYNSMEWRNKVRRNTGMAEIREYAHRIEVVGLPTVVPEPESLTRRVYPGFFACNTHQGEHFFILGRNGRVGQLRTADCHGSVCMDQHFADYADCVPVTGGQMETVMRDGLGNAAVSVRFASREQMAYVTTES